MEKNKYISIPGEIDGGTVASTILLALSEKAREALSTELTFVDLVLNDLLQEGGASVKYCYFINSGMVSFLSLATTGKNVETGLAGKEGFVGSALAAGFLSSGSRAVVQGTGTAFRIGRRDFVEALKRYPALRLGLMRYFLKANFQTSQIAACNQLHQIDARLARWLLMTQDCMESSALNLTHEFLAQMLVANRTTVSLAAGRLQKDGLVEYRRGKIWVLDRARLEKLTCECYGIITHQLRKWDIEAA